MAATDLQIAQLALQNIGDRFDITSLDEASPEAEQVALVYDHVRDMLLREHPWGFAKRFTNPAALVGTPPDDWLYMFTYPADALKVTRIVNPAGRKALPIEFAVGRNADNNKVLMCNLEEPEIEYIKLITDAGMYDPAFVLAFALRLSAAIAMPITGDRGIMLEMRQLASEAVSLAKSEDGNEGVEVDDEPDPDWITARS
jgi:hypothetical protein